MSIIQNRMQNKHFKEVNKELTFAKKFKPLYSKLVKDKLSLTDFLKYTLFWKVNVDSKDVFNITTI
jgi:hypothetical protein